MGNAFFEAVGLRVRDARERSQMSQDELAETTGMNPAHVGRVERGLQNISLITLARLALALGTSPSDLLQGLQADPDVFARKPRRNARLPRRPLDPQL